MDGEAEVAGGVLLEVVEEAYCDDFLVFGAGVVELAGGRFVGGCGGVEVESAVQGEEPVGFPDEGDEGGAGELFEGLGGVFGGDVVEGDLLVGGVLTEFGGFHFGEERALADGAGDLGCQVFG